MSSDLGLRRESIVVDGCELYYWRTATSAPETMLLLHGLGGDHRGLAEVADQIQLAVSGINLVIPDLPGYGESVPLAQPHALANYASAVEALRTELDLGRVHLLGHSLGASIALVHASANSAALRSLCLINPVSTATGFTATLGKLYYRIAALLPAPLARFWLASRPAVYLADIAILTTKDKALRRRILREDYENYRRSNVPAMIESFLSYFDTDFTARAGQIEVDTLLVTGDRDGIAPPESVTGLASVMPAATVRMLPGGGHLMPMEQPAEVAVLVAEFLTRMMEPAEGE